MIVEFSVKNFRSIKDLQTISFVATGLKSAEKYSHIDQNNTAEEGAMVLFKTLGLYGSNASGKSNVIKALDYFIRVIISQPSSLSNLSALAEPFLYQPTADETESFFQIVFIFKNVKYRYGFTVVKNVTASNSVVISAEKITNEWLFATKTKNMTALFERVDDKLTKNNLENKAIIPAHIPYQHTLFLTHAAAFDNTGDCKIITDYLRASVVSNFDTSHQDLRWMSISYLENKNNLDAKKNFLHLLSVFNLKYDDAILQKDNESSEYKVFPQDKIILTKNFKLDRENLGIKLNLKNNESSGTQKMFDLAGLLLIAFNMQMPAFIILDEIDSNFHPSLLIKLIEIFNDPRINRSNSQLIFTSHDTNLMSPAVMRRDQFYFTEKNEDDSTRLYSLADLKGIRNDADFAKQYLSGYYGALPVLGRYDANMEDLQV